MKIVHDFGRECQDGVNTYLDLEDYADQDPTSVLMYGVTPTCERLDLHEQFKGYRKTLLNLWDPCSFYDKKDRCGQDYFGMISHFDDVYTICPFTAQWVNEKLGIKKNYYTFYPINPKYIPEPQDKIHDVCYFGGVHDPEHKQCIDIISKFDYRFISQGNHAKVTNHNVSNLEKLKIVAQSKITVCYNLLYLKPHQIPMAMSWDGWQNNQALERLPKEHILPQFKSRVHEAALTRTLILCKRDPWNLIEDFYKPGEDFIYFNDNSELEGVIREVLEDYEDYEKMLDNAQQKALNYTSENLVKMIGEKNEMLSSGI
jgi:hypothetical protein